MNELREKIRTILVNHSDNKRANDKIENDIFKLIQSEPINKELRCVTGCTCYSGGEVKHHEDCEHYPESLSKSYNDQIKELEGKLELKDVILNEIGKIHKEKLDQITQLQKKIEELKKIINVGSKEVIGKIDVAAKDATHKRFDSNEHAFRTGWIDGRGLYVMEQLTKLSEFESLTNKTDEQ